MRNQTRVYIRNENEYYIEYTLNKSSKNTCYAGTSLGDVRKTIEGLLESQNISETVLFLSGLVFLSEGEKHLSIGALRKLKKKLDRELETVTVVLI
ncbi:MAG: hypothetical protein KKG75_02080 [Nanoarchaeota archaeon]|nr:hypothetical protein [Nanoarchaeota archaeon]